MLLHLNPPANEQDFEHLSLRVYRSWLGIEDLKLHGCRGEQQHGVDLFGTDRSGRRIGVQCKLRNTAAGLTLAEIKAEAAKAVTFHPPLAVYIVATTAPRKGVLQREFEAWVDDTRGDFSYEVRLHHWDDIAGAINDDPELRKSYPVPREAFPLVARVPEDASGGTVLAAPSGWTRTARSLSDEIAAADRHTVAGEPVAAGVLLDRLEEEVREQSLPALTIRWREARARAFLNLELPGRALDEYRQAYAAAPDSQAGRRCGARVALAEDGSAAARAVLQPALDEPATLEEATLEAWLEVAGPDASLEQLEALVPTHLNRGWRIPYLLSFAAEQEELLQRAVELAEDARTRSADRPTVVLRLSHLMVLRCRFDDLAPGEEVEAVARDALAALTPHLPMLCKGRTREMLADLELTLASVHQILGRRSEAEACLARACGTCGQNAGLAIHAAQLYMLLDRPGDAIGVLSALGHAETVMSEAFRGQLLLDRRQEGDVEAAQACFVALEKHLPELHPSLLRNVLIPHQGACEWLQDIEGGRALLEAARRSQAPAALLGVIEARQAILEGRTSDAAKAATAAVAAIDDDTGADVVRRLAGTLEKLDRHEEAMMCWLRLLTPGIPDHDLRSAVHCADEAEHWDVVAELARSIRVAGTFDNAFMWAELRAVQSLGVSASLRLVEELLAEPRAESLHADLRVARTNLLLNQNPHHRGTLTLQDVKPVDELEEAAEGEPIVRALAATADPSHAEAYAVELYRSFPGETATWDAVIAAARLGRGPTDEAVKPTRVSAGTAVLYEGSGGGDRRWMFIVGSDTQRRQPHEHREDDPVAAAAMGCSVGDVFEVNRDPRPPRSFRVVDILSRFHHLFHECVQMSEGARGRDASLVSLDIPNLPDGSPDREALAATIATFERPEVEMRRLYQEQAIVSLHKLGDPANITAFAAIRCYGGQDGFAIRCSPADGRTLKEAAADLSQASSLVLDETAIGTLFHLEEMGHGTISGWLSQLPMPVRVSELTLDAIETEARSAWGRGEEVTRMGTEDGELRVLSWTAEEAAGFLETSMSRFQAVRDAAMVEPWHMPQEADPKRRKAYKAWFGAAAEHVCEMSKAEGAVLWTDDQAFGGLLRNEHGVRRVWTQAVSQWLHRQNRIRGDVDGLTAAWLQRWGYTTTQIGLHSLLAAARAVAWDPTKRPFRDVLEALADPGNEERSVIGCAILLLRAALREPVAPELLEAVVQHTLDTIAQRNAGTASVRAMLRPVNLLFGVDVMGASWCRGVIRIWLEQKGRGPGGLVLPD